MLSDRFTSTVNQTGTIEFDTPQGGQISVLGLRFPPSGRVTTIPVLASTDTGGGSMAHLAVGDGWTTTIELVNYGTNFAQANLSFFDDNGEPLSLPVDHFRKFRAGFHSEPNLGSARQARRSEQRARHRSAKCGLCAAGDEWECQWLYTFSIWPPESGSDCPDRGEECCFLYPAVR